MSDTAVRRAEDEVVEGSLLVAELGEPAGLAVWRALRDARRWCAERVPTTPQGRVGALRGVPLPEELWAPLAVLACLGDGIGAHDEARLLHACRRIARWAEAKRAWRTALAWEAVIASEWPAARYRSQVRTRVPDAPRLTTAGPAGSGRGAR